jgi:putative peptidoglycan lipid II flippase
MGPVTLGLGLINFNQVIGTLFAARLIDPNLAPAAIDAAFRLYMLPQGMFSVAVATVLFPALSRLAALGDTDAFRRTLNSGLRQIAFLLVPASIASAVLAEPIVRLLYERGEFGPDETVVVAQALAAFSLGLTFNGAMLMLNRAFFGLQAPWTPTAVALGNLLLNAALYGALYRVGVWGIPFAISLANVAGALALLVLLRRRTGRLDVRETGRAAGLIVLAGAALAAVAYPVWWGLDEALGRSLAAQVVSVGGALAAGGAAYLLACRALGVAELQALLSLRRRRAR